MDVSRSNTTHKMAETAADKGTPLKEQEQNLIVSIFTIFT